MEEEMKSSVEKHILVILPHPDDEILRYIRYPCQTYTKWDPSYLRMPNAWRNGLAIWASRPSQIG